jgi:hypothetical protein
MRVIKRVHINKICYAILEGKKGGHPPQPPFFSLLFLFFNHKRTQSRVSLQFTVPESCVGFDWCFLRGKAEIIYNLCGLGTDEVKKYNGE